MIPKEWVWMYFKDEWNEPHEDDDDTIYEDGIDKRPTPKEKPYNDDDYDY
jgi:hypothetical protein